MDIFNFILFALGVVGGFIAIVLFMVSLRKQEHRSVVLMAILLPSALLVALYLIFQWHLSFFFSGLIVCLAAEFIAAVLLICGELFLWRAALQPLIQQLEQADPAAAELSLRRATLQPLMAKKLWWVTILILGLSIVPAIFWMLGAWGNQPSSPLSPPAVALQAYCQALVAHDFARALTHVSDVTTHTTVLSQVDLAQHVGADEKKAGSKLRSCSSTVSDITASGGIHYAAGSVIYSFNPGVWYYKNYSLFQDASSAQWLINTAFWQDPQAPGVY